MLNNGCAIKDIIQRGELKKTLSYRGFYFVNLHSLFYYSIVQNDFFQVVIEKLLKFILSIILIGSKLNLVNNFSLEYCNNL